MPNMAQRTAAQVRAIFADHEGLAPERASVTCSGCRTTGTVEGSARLSDAEVAAQLGEQGWSFLGWRTWLCPRCALDPETRTRIASTLPDQGATDS